MSQYEMDQVAEESKQELDKKSPFLKLTNEVINIKQEEQRKSPIQSRSKFTTQHSPQPHLMYMDFLVHVLKKYEEEYKLKFMHDSTKKSGYTLYEDLKIIYELSQEAAISSRSYKILAQNPIINRSEESIKSRYKDFLIHITNYDLDTIFVFVEEQGIQGAFHFEKNREDGTKRLTKVLPLNTTRVHALEQKSKQNNTKIVQKFAKELEQRKQLKEQNKQQSNKSLQVPQQLKKHIQTVSPSRAFLRTPVDDDLRGQQHKVQEKQKRTFREMLDSSHEESSEEEQEIYTKKKGKRDIYPQFPYPPYAMGMPPPYYNPYMYGYPLFQPQNQMQELQKSSDPYNQYNPTNNQQPQYSQFPQQYPPMYLQYPQYPYQPQQQTYPAYQGQQQQQMDRISPKKSQKKSVDEKAQSPVKEMISLKQFKAKMVKQQKEPETQKLEVNQKKIIQNYFEVTGTNNLDADEELVQIIEKISEARSVSFQFLLDAFDKVSGDFNLLEQFLQTRDQNLLWDEEDDLILSQVRSENSPELKLFYRMKGEENVKKRIPYLGLNLPFKL